MKVMVLDQWSAEKKENEVLKAKLNLALQNMDLMYRHSPRISVLESYGELKVMAYNTIRQIMADEWEVTEISTSDEKGDDFGH